MKVGLIRGYLACLPYRVKLPIPARAYMTGLDLTVQKHIRLIGKSLLSNHPLNYNHILSKRNCRTVDFQPNKQ